MAGWIESAAIHLANTSIRSVHKMINGARGELSAAGEFVAVRFDFKTRQSIPWTGAMAP